MQLALDREKHHRRREGAVVEPHLLDVAHRRRAEVVGRGEGRHHRAGAAGPVPGLPARPGNNRTCRPATASSEADQRAPVRDPPARASAPALGAVQHALGELGRGDRHALRSCRAGAVVRNTMKPGRSSDHFRVLRGRALAARSMPARPPKAASLGSLIRASALSIGKYPAVAGDVPVQLVVIRAVEDLAGGVVAQHVGIARPAKGSRRAEPMRMRTPLNRLSRAQGSSCPSRWTEITSNPAWMRVPAGSGIAGRVVAVDAAVDLLAERDHPDRLGHVEIAVGLDGDVAGEAEDALLAARTAPTRGSVAELSCAKAPAGTTSRSRTKSERMAARIFRPHPNSTLGAVLIDSSASA